MIKISQKTLDDLEFDAVVLQVAAFSITALGRSEIEQLVPYGSKEQCIQNLNLVHEIDSQSKIYKDIYILIAVKLDVYIIMSFW